MKKNKIPEYILLSELITKLKDKEYYQVFAKTLLMTAKPPRPIPPDNELVKNMFQFFIQNKQLDIYDKDSETPYNGSEAEFDQKEFKVKVTDLKKLYANKCIVLPNSLFYEKT